MEGWPRKPDKVHARQKVELWERWKSGQCVADIARALREGTRAVCIDCWRSPAGSLRRHGEERLSTES